MNKVSFILYHYHDVTYTRIQDLFIFLPLIGNAAQSCEIVFSYHAQPAYMPNLVRFGEELCKPYFL